MAAFVEPKFLMPNDSLSRWRQSHDFRHAHEGVAERRLRWVVGITLVTMLAELVGGYAFGSMALVADGWHMGSHAAALSISVIGYVAARRFVGHTHFTFGTGKIGPLAAYSSALLLGLVALIMAVQSIERLVSPVRVHFDQALTIAVIGFVVNLACAWILRERHAHGSETHAHASHHHDHNLAAAYLHVLADALTSVLAIAALICGKYLGWVALDPVMGIIGAAVIAHWSIGLLRSTGRVLLDAEDTGALTNKVRRLIEQGTAHRVADLHVWRVGIGVYACIVTVVTRDRISAEEIKTQLADIRAIRHLTVEVNRCE
jgi:cation diffusion facilitator family transporter